MTELPATLTYFGTLQSASQVINKLALPLQELQHLCDPFLPCSNSPMTFGQKELFETAVRYISHSVLGKSVASGQPNHPLQKVIKRWRSENRFSNEAEIKTALQGLLPAMVEQSFIKATKQHQEWLDYIGSKRLVTLFERFQELPLWQRATFQHKCIAIKFKCEENSIFRFCKPVKYQKSPATMVNQIDIVEYMVGILPEMNFDLENILLTQNYAERSLKEWRLVIDTNEHKQQWIEFPGRLIQSVYIGALVADNTVKQFKQHLANSNPRINVYRARCKTNEFGLEFEKISIHSNEDDLD